MSSCLVDVVVRLYPHFTRQRSETFQTRWTCLLNALEATLRSLDVLIAGQAEGEARRAMAGLRGWERQLLK